MITLHLPEDLAREVGLASICQLAQVRSLEELFAAVERQAPGFLRRVTEPGGGLRPHLNLFVGERPVARERGLRVALGAHEDVWLLRAVSGG